jgi:two-component system nitrogen regulation sensor histidine kinase GlnL
MLKSIADCILASRKASKMNRTTMGDTLQPSAAEAREQFRFLQAEFDRLVVDLGGNPESNAAVNFKSILTAQSEALTEHLEILSAIFYISSLFSGHSRLSEVLTLVMDSVKNVLNFGRVTVLLLSQDRRTLTCSIASGLTQDQQSLALSRPFLMDQHDCIETKVARYGTTYLITDINDPRLTDTDRKTHTRFERGSTIYVPIETMNGIIGVFGVDRQSSFPTIKPRDIGRVQLFANYMGVLIENAKLYESIIDHKNRFENIVRQSPDGIITTDLSGRINLINRAAEKLLGISKGEALGRPIDRMLSPKIIEKVRQVLSKQDRAHFYDLNWERKNSKVLVLNLSALNIRGISESGLLLMLQDNTEKKMIDHHIQRLDKLASIGTMAAGIAHEIRSPLTSITMDLDSAYEFASDKQRVKQTIVQVLNEIERIDKIVNNLLRFSRPNREDFSYFAIRSVIEESISLVKKKTSGKRISFEVLLSPEPMQILGSSDGMKQVMVNMLINAVEAIEIEGVIKIRTELIDGCKMVIADPFRAGSVDTNRNMARIVVEDNGVGIPSEFRGKIFDPYFTTKTSGTGLGLAIVAKIVGEHKGYISFTSSPGRGTLFEVFMPAAMRSDQEVTLT